MATEVSSTELAFETKVASVEMMADRGYNIEEVYSITANGAISKTTVNEQELFLSENPISEMDFLNTYFGEGDFLLGSIYSHTEKDEKTIIFFFENDESQISAQECQFLHDIHRILTRDDPYLVKNIVLVSDRKYATGAKKLLDGIVTSKLQYYNYGMIFPPTHILQPEFRLLSEEEAEELKNGLSKRFPVESNLSSFPRMYETDPVAKYYAWPPGRVVEVQRYALDGTVNRYQPEYRIIIPGTMPIPESLNKVI